MTNNLDKALVDFEEKLFHLQFDCYELHESTEALRKKLLPAEESGEELKPCPFCGKTEYLDFRDDGRWIYVRCNYHNAPLLGPACLGKDMAIFAWNKR